MLDSYRTIGVPSSKLIVMLYMYSYSTRCSQHSKSASMERPKRAPNLKPT